MSKLRLVLNAAGCGLVLGMLPALAAPALPGAGEGALLAQEAGADVDSVYDADADSLYQAARAALRAGDHRQAARTFEEVHERYPESPQAADAYYWQAFSLYRLGGVDDLRQALAALEAQTGAGSLARLRSDSRELATRLRGLLARLGDPAAAERVVEQAAEAAESCPEEEADVQMAAMQALMNMDEERALPILRKVVARRDPCSEPLRERAVFLIADASEEQSAELLLDIARNDPSRDVRLQAVRWLSEVESERAVDILGEILRTSDDRELQEYALFALAEHESDRSGAILRTYAENASAPEELRGRAIFMLGEHDESAANAQFLRELYGRLDSPELREMTLFAISEMDDADPAWLLERALDPNEPLDLRKRALFLAAEAGASAERMAELYSSVQEKEMKEQLLFALAEADDPTAADALIRVVREETDPELRMRAIFWLGESDDPRAADVLMEILEP